MWNVQWDSVRTQSSNFTKSKDRTSLLIWKRCLITIMHIWYIFSAISCWQVFCYSTTSSSNQPPSHLHYHIRCIAALGQHMYHETVSLSQMQDHAVLKDDEVSPLVPAARCQRRQRRRQPRRLRRAGLLPLVPACQLPASSAVATVPWRDCSRGSK